ncbi:redoxin domain-containing protein [Demequina sp. NBRC 110052]|uniref:redoxin domain-containing protein n=1 Tax=Demequina sp. NBRC 110052 TaxID=1570341 RepID=UPI001F2D0B9C|nr:redoxin domain-containing protein [Demequina sp. NBRC 110052]
MTNPLVGHPAPAFSLTDQHGRQVSLDDLRGTATLLVFVPFAFSDTCTNELIDLRDAADLRSRDDLRVVVVSCDSMYTLKAWGDTHRFAETLLSDFWPHGDASRDYGVFNPRKGLATRGTFLIDAEGVVRWAVVNPTGEARDVDDYRREVAALLG